MIYVKAKNGVVELVHYQPFHEVHGTGKTREELETEGFFVDSIPEPLLVEGKSAILKVDAVANALYYEYVDRPLQADERIKELEETVAEMLYIMAQNGLVTV